VICSAQVSGQSWGQAPKTVRVVISVVGFEQPDDCRKLAATLLVQDKALGQAVAQPRLGLTLAPIGGFKPEDSRVKRLRRR